MWSHQHVMHYQLNVSISGLAGLVRFWFFNDPTYSYVFMMWTHTHTHGTEEFTLLVYVFVLFTDFFCTGIHRRTVTSTAAGWISAGQRTGFHRLQAAEAISGKVMWFVFSARSGVCWRFYYDLLYNVAHAGRCGIWCNWDFIAILIALVESKTV